MNIKERQVRNAADLAFFMVNVSHVPRRQTEFSGMSVIDLKARFRAGGYVRETLKLLPRIPEGISIQSTLTKQPFLDGLIRRKRWFNGDGIVLSSTFFRIMQPGLTEDGSFPPPEAQPDFFPTVFQWSLP